MRLTLVKSDCLEDWYTIERAEHDGRVWWEPMGEYGLTLRMSCRISDACVEGTAAEMLAIARGIRERTDVAFKRCAVEFDRDKVLFWSPRNSLVPAEVHYVDALELAVEIEAKLCR